MTTAAMSCPPCPARLVRSKSVSTAWSLIISNRAGRVTFVSEPVPGKHHDMAKLKDSESEKILKAAGGVLGKAPG